MYPDFRSGARPHGSAHPARSTQPAKADLYERHVADLTALHAASTAIVQGADVRSICVRIVELLGTLLPYRRTLVVLRDDRGRLEVVAHAAENRDAMQRECRRITELIRNHPHTGVVRWVVTHNRPILLGDAQTDQRYLAGQHSMKSELCVPIGGCGQAVGAISIESPVRDAFSQRDENILSIVANHLGLALENSMLKAKLSEAAKTRADSSNAGAE